MSSTTKRLFDILKNVRHTGDFYATGTFAAYPPHLEVEGVGRIALPLLPLQAEQLVAVAEQAPYGRGSDTLVDTTVRRTWQIDANRVILSGKHWQKNLDDIVNRAAVGLGVSGKVKAELYKLLVYDAGSFFISHRDTEKAAGMFATLVIVLPSEYSGGELVVTHQQQQVKLDLSCDDPSEIAFAAFYADCVHEVLPVSEGCRLTLIYNLLRADKEMPLPKPPDYHEEQDSVATLLRNWAAELATDAHEQTPEKLIYRLEHAYTPAELGFDALKNADAAVADVLVAAAGQADCDIHLALVSIEENGNAEYAGRGGRYWDEDDFEIGEVFDRIETVSEWRRLDGQPSPLPALPFNEHEFCPPEDFENMEFDDVEFHEATGNEGASFERTYSRAALVIWPRTRYLAILNQAGLRATLPVLHDFCQRWESENKDPNLWHEAHALAGHMLRDGLSQCLGRNFYRSNVANDFLHDMYRLSDSEHLGRFWSMVAASGFYNKNNSAALVQAAELLAWTDVVKWTEQAVRASVSEAQEACASLLAGLSTAKTAAAKDLGAAAQALFAALPGDPERFPELQPWERSRITVNTDLVADVLVAFSAIDPALAESALTYLLAWPATYPMDSILMPAALRLTEMPASRELPVVEHLRNAARMHLQRRIAEELEPPADWRRDSQINCSCKDCAELRSFLDNPAEATWVFKAVETRRKHVESTIKRCNCDVNYVTNRNQRPYSLVCTKNQASYQRRVEQRNNDLDALARLAVG